MYLSILLPGIMVLYALYKKKLTIPGILTAFVFGFIITYYGGYLAFGALALTILIILVTDKVKKGKKDKKRTVYQIISNLLTPTLSIILYTLTNKNMFYVMYYAVLATSLADSMASSIGTLSKKPPVNIFTMEKLQTGESGGVSWLGILASLLGGLIIAVIYFIKIQNISDWLLITIMGLIGSLVDSVLGIICQGKYKCSVCKKNVETKKHCQKPAKLLRGYPQIDNNLVNLLSNVIVFIFCYLLLI